MVAKNLLVDDNNNSLFQTNMLLYVKFRREKHYLVKHFAFLKTFAINIYQLFDQRSLKVVA